MILKCRIIRQFKIDVSLSSKLFNNRRQVLKPVFQFSLVLKRYLLMEVRRKEMILTAKHKS
jgi:hypothetical protein